MLKRPYPESPDHSSDDSPSYSAEYGANSGLLSNLLRVVLSRHAKFLKIRREHLQAVNTPKVSIKIHLKTLDDEMKRIFALLLLQVGNEYRLVSSLEGKSKAVLHELLTDDVNETDLQSLANSTVTERSRQKHPTFGSSSESVFGSIQLLVIIITVLSQNRISEQNLLEALSTFGLSDRSNISVPILNIPLQSVLAEMTRREYLQRSTARSKQQDGSVSDYSLGQRSLQEFNPSNILQILRTIIPGAENDGKVITALQRCFDDYDFQALTNSGNEEDAAAETGGD